MPERLKRHCLTVGEFLEEFGQLAAAVYHDGGRYASTQIFLRSSTREVTIRVRRSGDSFPAQKVVDRTQRDRCRGP